MAHKSRFASLMLVNASLVALSARPEAQTPLAYDVQGVVADSRCPDSCWFRKSDSIWWSDGNPEHQVDTRVNAILSDHINAAGMFTSPFHFRPNGSWADLGRSWNRDAQSDDPPLINYSWTDLGGGQVQIEEWSSSGGPWHHSQFTASIYPSTDYSLDDVWGIGGNYFATYQDTYWGDHYLEDLGGRLWSLFNQSTYPCLTGLGWLWIHSESGEGYVFSSGPEGSFNSFGYSVVEDERGWPYFVDGYGEPVSLTYGDMPLPQGVSQPHWLVDDSVAFMNGQIYEWTGAAWATRTPGSNLSYVATAPCEPYRLFATWESGTPSLRAADGSPTLTTIGTSFTSIGQIEPVNNSLSVFAGGDSANGTELWLTDGTAAGTRLHADLLPGSSSSNPRSFQVCGDKVFFIADAPRPNTLWVLDVRELDWRRNPENGHFYKLTQAGSWHSALTEAQAADAVLATIRGASEQAWLWGEFGPENLWIGLEDLDLNGIFEWVSGEPLGFATWCPGQPNGRNAGESVVHMSDYPGWCSGPWNDQDPNDSFRGVMERLPAAPPVFAIGSGCLGAEAYWAYGNPSAGQRLGLALDMGPSFGQGVAVALCEIAAAVPSALDLGVILGDPSLTGCSFYMASGGILAASGLGRHVDLEWDLPATLPPGLQIDVQGIGVSASQSFSTTNLLRARLY